MAQFVPKTEDLTHLKQALGESDQQHYAVQNIPAPDTDSSGDKVILKEDILDFRDEGFTLQNVLSPKECQHYIHEGEKMGFGEIHGAKPEYRNSTR